ncbi:hypothetical protein HaLaN_30826 [Haematococcus lacustris]|uniref:Uncharacterized protein n=1 Tax=Haematococcus lacustris TaxID=44745 RepID=A0A6A0AGF6_HAELA|nr:hypothetical protein HaLaN_30826 [Haematococcus lacustris]
MVATDVEEADRDLARAWARQHACLGYVESLIQSSPQLFRNVVTTMARGKGVEPPQWGSRLPAVEGVGAEQRATTSSPSLGSPSLNASPNDPQDEHSSEMSIEEPAKGEPATREAADFPPGSPCQQDETAGPLAEEPAQGSQGGQEEAATRPPVGRTQGPPQPRRRLASREVSGLLEAAPNFTTGRTRSQALRQPAPPPPPPRAQSVRAGVGTVGDSRSNTYLKGGCGLREGGIYSTAVHVHESATRPRGDEGGGVNGGGERCWAGDGGRVG